MKKLLQLKLLLNDSKPPIWRRILIDQTLTFTHLHLIIQAIMNWENYHLHAFTINKNIIISNNGEWDEEQNLYGQAKPLDADLIQLASYLDQEGKHILYEYDFGDSWELKISVEKILDMQPDNKFIECIGGKRAAPPEDSGGIYGYTHSIQILQDKNNPDHKKLRNWYGKQFDPETFNLDKINKNLVSFNSNGTKSKRVSQ